MNISTIATRALNRAKLSVSDLNFRDLAYDFLDEIIQEHWNQRHWQFRKKSFTLSTSASTEEYTLDKLATVESIVQNSMRGSNPIRNIRYRPSSEHYRVRFSSDSGNPYRYREGTVQGYQNNPSAASVITFASSLANYTTGTVTVVNGSRRLVFSGSTITLDMIGRWIRFGTDTKAYRLVSRDFGSSSIFYIQEPYEGVTAPGITFTIGDIQQKVTVLGYVSGQLQEEEVQLNGTSSVLTTKSFTSILKISKSDKTHGYITGTSNAAAVSNIILDPGETDATFETIKFDPIPSATETINYDAYIKHPFLYKPTDSPLFPSQFHTLLVLDLYIRLTEEWLGKDPGQSVLDRRNKLLDDMVLIDNRTDGWRILQETEESSEKERISNLPNAYGYQDEY